MSDTRHAHHFDPNRNGLCKTIVGTEMCHLPEDAPVHTRQLKVERSEIDILRGELAVISHRVRLLEIKLGLSEGGNDER